jgi:hypothetical protein
MKEGRGRSLQLKSKTVFDSRFLHFSAVMPGLVPGIHAE